MRTIRQRRAARQREQAQAQRAREVARIGQTIKEAWRKLEEIAFREAAGIPSEGS